MQEAGATFDMPDGSALRVLRSPSETSPSETAGELVELELAVPARSAAVPKHGHPRQEEEYEVLEGRFDVFVDGHWRVLAEGESLTIAPGERRTRSGARASPRASATSTGRRSTSSSTSGGSTRSQRRGRSRS